MKKNALLSFSVVLCAVVLSFTGCEIVSNPDKAADTYTVTFNGNAGTDTVTSLPSPLTGISSGSKVAAPAGTPVRSGYYFGGWYKETGCTTKWNFESDTVSSSVTLYASWLSVADYCRIQFDTGASGWVCEPLIAKKGSVVKLETYYMTQMVIYSSTNPDFTTRTHVYTDSNYENRYTGGDSYTAAESTTFYFKMIRLYAVTIYPNGGKFSDSSTTAKTVKMSEGDTLASIGEYNAKPTRE